MVPAVIAAVASGRRVALATVVAVRGSTPRHVGARMAIAADGEQWGTIGGGRIEHEVVGAAKRVAAGEVAAHVVRHHLVRDLAMCCGGSMEVLVADAAQAVDAMAAMLDAQVARQPVIMATPLDGAAATVRPASIDEQATFRAAIVDGCLLEQWLPSERAIVFGAGHVGRAIGELAARCGFQVVLCDDDDTGALTHAAPWASKVVDDFDVAAVEAKLGGLGSGDYALIVTRDHAVDQRILECLVGRDDLTYIGMIGSRGKVGRFRKRLVAKGLDRADFTSRVRAPIGLAIGAETPAEIAVAVVAELIAVRRLGGPAVGEWSGGKSAVASGVSGVDEHEHLGEDE